MIKIILAIYFLIVPFCGVKTQNQADTVYYLCIGQSNMAGRAKIPDSLKNKIIERVYLMDTSGKLEQATLPLNKYSNIRKDIKMQGLGPAWSFAEQMTHFTTKNVALIVNARGGTSIQEWEKDGDLYEKTLNRVREIARTGKLKGILWHQGESNCSGKYKISAEEYKKRFRIFVSELRKDLYCDTIPVIVCQLGQWEWTDKETITKFNNMLLELSKEIPYISCITSEGLIAAYPGTTDPHFGTEAQIEMGKRYALEFVRLYGIP